VRLRTVTLARDSNVTAPAVTLPALAAPAATISKAALQRSLTNTEGSASKGCRGTAAARVLLIEGLPHCQKYLCVTFAESNKGEVAQAQK